MSPPQITMLRLKKTVFYGISSIGTACTHKLCFPSLRLSSLRFISTESDATRDSFVVSYLVNSCHLSRESALSASKFLNFKTPDKPDSVINFLKDRGCSQVQISEIVRKHPPVLVSKPHKTLLPKFQFFYSQGLSSHDLAKLLAACPHVLRVGLDGQILPTVNCLAELLKSHDKAIALIKQCPSICCGNLVEMVALLRDHGVPQSKISLFVKRWPRLTWSTVDRMRTVIKEVEAMGFSPSKSQFVLAVAAIMFVGKSAWEKKLNVYKYWGLSEEDVMAAFRKLPWCMMATDDKIMTMMDFFVSKMSLEPHCIVQRPVLLSLSLEKRMIPRASVLQHLISKGLLEKKCSTLCYLFHMPEKTFMRKCVNCYEEAPELMKLYAKKLDLLQSKVGKEGINS